MPVKADENVFRYIYTPKIIEKQKINFYIIIIIVTYLNNRKLNIKQVIT